jgi:adenine-specific DNA methylase
VEPSGPTGRRLIETTFPLRQASLDSVHEKNVRHGHISTLHIWPARRPLAACRAALIATLLPDPGTSEERRRLAERIGGRVVERREMKKVGSREVETVREETEGGLLHWGRENSPDLDWFREEIRKAYGVRAPKVLDPFAGGGSIPLEAMRLGCEAIAMDINPVAWFILKCTLDYPHRMAGKTLPLPKAALESAEFMEAFLRGTGRVKKKADLERQLQGVQLGLFPPPEADLAWHVRAWGRWVFQRAKVDLERFYPVVDGKPTVAYLWARTVKCKNCRGEVPLLKTRWLCRKPDKKVLLTLRTEPGRPEAEFGVRVLRPDEVVNDADTKGTMSRAGATCPHCGVITMMEDLRQEGRAGRLGQRLVAVVVEGERGKEYRPPTGEEIRRASEAGGAVASAFDGVPFGTPDEPLPAKEALGIRVPLYGLDTWGKLFNPRQLLALGSFVRHTRAAREAMAGEGYPAEWVEPIGGLLALALDKLADYNATLVTWHLTGEKISHVFVRYALPIAWDCAELNPFSESTGNYLACLEWICRAIEHTCIAALGQPIAQSLRGSAIRQPCEAGTMDLVVTDPPYYDAIPYSDTMDFFYVWLRRSTRGLAPDIDAAFSGELGPKWDEAREDGELIDDDSRFGGDRERSRAVYEAGMVRAFQECYRVLRPEGRMVVVFAQKNPSAWEALVSAMLQAGFVVTASWPIQTEMGNRTRALTGAALSSSVWLVCRKRPPSARPGWDNQVLEETRARLWGVRADEAGEWVYRPTLREFWDAGIRGPDFVWAATGPALEAYSRYPAVKKADRPDELLTVSEFLRHVRRLVVDFVVGRVLTPEGEPSAAPPLDDVTTYYLLHRQAFQFSETPIGAVILYSVSCGLSDRDLVEEYDLLSRSGGSTAPADLEEDGSDSGEDAQEEGEEEETAGASGGTSKVRLRPWHQRRGKRMGYENGGRPVPLIDQVHRLMHLWKTGDVRAVNHYIGERGLQSSGVFARLLQALIELSPVGDEERTLLESISNHLAGLRLARRPDQLFDSQQAPEEPFRGGVKS